MARPTARCRTPMLGGVVVYAQVARADARGIYSDSDMREAVPLYAMNLIVIYHFIERFMQYLCRFLIVNLEFGPYMYQAVMETLKHPEWNDGADGCCCKRSH